jgi:LPS-assembly protein
MQPAVPPFARLILVLSLAAAFPQARGASSLQLKPAGQLSPAAAKDRPAPGPTHLEADRIVGQTDRVAEAEGRVLMRNLREQLEADWVRYDLAEDEVQARGHILLTRDRDRLQGSTLKLKLTPQLGDMQDVLFEFYSPDGKRARGEAKSLVFAGVDQYRMDEAVYTTCAADSRDWLLKIEDLNLDYTRNLGAARNVRVEFMDTPILYAPWMDFALDDSRKSGFLAPSYGASDDRGLELVVPWYWNIAPNRDATFTPRYMSKRGLQLASEFRYQEKAERGLYGGDLNLEYLPSDQEADRNRHHVYLRHRQDFGRGWSGNLEFERVSDDRYFTDLSSVISQTSRVNLPQQASLAYDGGWWRASGLYQRYQTLQDAAAPIVEPYHRVPQLALNAQRPLPGLPALQLNLASEFVYFDHEQGGRVQGARLYAYPSLALPLQTTYANITPKLGWHLTRYALDGDTVTQPDSIANNTAPPGGFADQTRTLPIFSLDASLLMERDWSFLGDRYIQTLEPRLYYLYVPYENQDRIPVFDSALKDLSLDQLFSENQFTSVDRINDAHQLTLALTSRLLARDSGIERIQVTLGQRLYFSDQKVGLTASAPVGNAATSDLIAQVSGQVTDKWRVTAGVQWSTSEDDVVKANLGGAYRAGPGKLFNADYRYTKDVVNPDNSINQIDLSVQWPLAPKWYGVGRLNYSFEDDRVVEGLAGFEYNAGCWSLRGVMQRLATTESDTSSAFFLQLELRGLTKLGPNPLSVLKRSISGYEKSDEVGLPQ